VRTHTLCPPTEDSNTQTDLVVIQHFCEQLGYHQLWTDEETNFFLHTPSSQHAAADHLVRKVHLQHAVTVAFDCALAVNMQVAWKETSEEAVIVGLVVVIVVVMVVDVVVIISVIDRGSHGGIKCVNGRTQTQS